MARGDPEERQRHDEAEAAIGAITGGMADAVVVEGAGGPELVELGASQMTRFIVERMPVGAALLDADGDLLYANAELARLLGEAERDLLDRPFSEFLHPADRIPFGTWLEADVAEPGQITARVGRGDRWATARIDRRPLDHRLPGVQAMIVADVTARRQAETEARRRGELLDAVDAAVIATDVDGRIVEWNKGAERLYGWTAGETSGRQADEFTIGPADPALRAEIGAALDDAGSWSGRYETRRRDGSRIPTFVRNVLTHSEDGRGPGMIGVSMDITEQVQAEVEAVRSRDYLRTLTDQMVEGLYAVDESDRATYMNHAAERLLGYEPGELIGAVMHHATHGVHSDGSPYPIEDCPITDLRLGDGGRRVVDEDVFIRSDGSQLPVAFTAASFQTPEGARGVLTVFRDISAEKADRDRLRRELESMSWVGPMRAALKEDGLLLHSQPIVSLPSREVVQEELLVRMRQAGEIVAAGQFMPAAEEHHMVEEIDRWVIPHALALAVELGRPIQFNISAASIQNPSTPLLIEEAIAAAGADPTSIVIEVTESGSSRSTRSPSGSHGASSRPAAGWPWTTSGPATEAFPT